MTPRSIDTLYYGRSFLLGRGARVMCRYVRRAAVRANRDENIDQTVFVYTLLVVGFSRAALLRQWASRVRVQMSNGAVVTAAAVVACAFAVNQRSS